MKFVSSIAFELLHAEMINFFTNSPDSVHNNSKITQHTLPPSPINVKAYAVIEDMGFKVGQKLVERMAARPDFASKAKISEPLDAIKFICKEFWTEVFKKAVSNLKANHKGTFVMKDASFPLLANLSTSTKNDSINDSKKYLVFACGLIRGGLNVLGVDAYVSADSTGFPSASFRICSKEKLQSTQS